MRPLRAFLFLVGAQLKQKSFWAFVIVFVLIGPVFVVLHSQKELDTRERRPLLSEKATVDHFDTSTYALATYGNKDTMLLFRSPASESILQAIISPALSTGLQLMPASSRTGYSWWSFTANGSLSDFHRLLLPVFMALAGVLILPSRSRLAALRVLLPTGSWGCFLMVSGVLMLQIFLLGVMSGLATGLALILTQSAAPVTFVFIAGYFGGVVICGIGFAMIGLAAAGLIRNRSLALLIVLVLVIGVSPFVSLAQNRLFAAAARWSPEISAVFLSPSPTLLYWVTSSILVPPQTTLFWLSQIGQQMTFEISPMLILAQLWARLLVFAGFWFVMAWVRFSRMVWASP